MSQLEFDEKAARQLEAWVAGQRELGERGDYYFAIAQFCFSARKPG
jgi:hypothetical protein